MKKLLLLFGFILALSACNSTSNDVEKINELRSSFRQTKETDMAKAQELDKAYKAFIVSHSKDTLVPTYLYESGDLNIRAFNKIPEGLKLFEQLFTEYPQHRHAPDALFTTAFIYENTLNQRDKAKKYYEEFLQKYPNHHFADDARQTLKYWDNPEEMLQQILEKAAKDTAK